MLSNKEKAAELGRMGEERVARYLRKHGLIIIKRNWHDKNYGEIDIIAESTEHIVFVEVKTRHNNALVSGVEAVDTKKRKRILLAVNSFMQKLNTNLPPRIDVAEVVLDDDNGEEKWSLNYYKNAF